MRKCNTSQSYKHPNCQTNAKKKKRNKAVNQYKKKTGRTVGITTEEEATKEKNTQPR
jgi:hypothetical protein